MNFVNDLVTGFIRPKKYGELLNKSTNRVVVYSLILILISSILVFFSLLKLSNAAQKYYKEVVPEYSYTNNELTMSEPFKLEFMGMIIAANSDTEFTKEDFGNNLQGLLFDKNSMLVRSTTNTAEVEYIKLTNGEDIAFSKQDIYLLAPTFKLIFYIMLVITIIMNIAGFFLGVLVVSLFGLIPNKICKLGFGKLYKAAIFSRGLPVILSLVLGRFIGGIPIIVSLLISFIILNIALTSITPKNK